MSKLPISSVQQGMILGESVYHPQSGKLLLQQGSRVTKEHLDKMETFGIRTIDVSDPYTVFVDIRENMENLLTGLYDSMLKRLYSPYPGGNMSDVVPTILPMLKQSIRSICTNPTICEICVNMQIIDFEALVRVGVVVSGYSMFLAALSGVPETEITHIGMAGLLHNVGLCEMFQLIRQEIDASHRPLWEQHPVYGHYMIAETELPREVSDLIEAHHEKYDGTGFPKGLKGELIPLGARIIAICADYQENIHKKNYLPYEAIEYVYGNSGLAYDPKIVRLYTENIPIYPLGAVVELSTGEAGVIVNIRKNRGPRPIVQIQYNRVHKPMTNMRLVDLGVEKTVFIKRVISY